jgi:hypothetical protein
MEWYLVKHRDNFTFYHETYEWSLSLSFRSAQFFTVEQGISWQAEWLLASEGLCSMELRGCIQKFPDSIDNELYAYLWYYSLLSPSKGYGGKTH